MHLGSGSLTLKERGDAPGLDDLSGGLHETQRLLSRLHCRLDRVRCDGHQPRSLQGQQKQGCMNFTTKEKQITNRQTMDQRQESETVLFTGKNFVRDWIKVTSE